MSAALSFFRFPFLSNPFISETKCLFVCFMTEIPFTVLPHYLKVCSVYIMNTPFFEMYVMYKGTWTTVLVSFFIFFKYGTLLLYCKSRKNCFIWKCKKTFILVVVNIFLCELLVLFIFPMFNFKPPWASRFSCEVTFHFIETLIKILSGSLLKSYPIISVPPFEKGLALYFYNIEFPVYKMLCSKLSVKKNINISDYQTILFCFSIIIKDC